MPGRARSTAERGSPLMEGEQTCRRCGQDDAIMTQLGHLTASRQTSSVSVPTVGGHGAGFLLVGVRAAPLSLPASPIPKASVLDASDDKGLARCNTVQQSSCLSLRGDLPSLDPP
jgi:hypothetical protein